MRPNLHSQRCFVLLAFLLLSAPLPLLAENMDWAQWRGPDRDGHASGPAWPNDLQGLEQAWRIDLGKGYPGPIVAGDRVFVVETVDDQNEGARALDRATGREIWKTTWTGHGKVPFFAARNGDWVRSTPAFDGETLYVGGMQELLLALDGATGEERWRVDIPARFGTKVPDFGFSSSPLVDGEHLYAQVANSLIKLDKRTGETIWRALANDGDIMVSGAFSSPVFGELHGRRQLIVQTRMTLHGLDPDNGEVLWAHDVPSFRGMNILTPVVHGDAIFTSTYRNNSFFFRVHQNDTESYAVEETWTHKVQAYMSTPVVVGDHAYMHLGNERLACIDLSTGLGCWTSEPLGKYWSMAVRDDKILALASNGELHLVRASPERFEHLGSRSVADAETWGHVAVAGNDIVVRELEGVALWRFGVSPEPAQQTAP